MVSDQEPPVKIYLLGTFEVERGDRILRANDWPRKKAAALLKRLAYQRRLVKDQAIDFLWPESDLTSGMNNLYRVLYSLRQTLDSLAPHGTTGDIFDYQDGVLNLGESVWVDVTEFEQLSKTKTGQDPDRQIAQLKEALNLYRGEFLPEDRYEEWTILPRESLFRHFREVNLILAEHYLENRDFSLAIELLSPLLTRDPADEPVHRYLMRAYALSGRRHDALRQYQACVDALASELDVPPGPETASLYDQIISNRLVLQKDPAPAASWTPPVPVSLDSKQPGLFVGRQVEIGEISGYLQELRQGRGSTIIIAGESGIGKTRLALEILNLADKAGMATLLGAAYEQEERLPFQPFIEAFDHYLAKNRQFKKENPITHFHRLDSSDPQQEHWSLYKATANFIQEIAGDKPLVFLLDDLHAADETSLQLFHYLARQTRFSPVMFIATYRIDSPTSIEFNALVSALYREELSETFKLGSIPKEAVQEILGETLEGSVSDELCQAVNDITAGNPFFTQEIARALLKYDKVSRQGGCWSLKPGEELSASDNLNALLRQKISRLGPNVEAVLSSAAVIGREFSFEILQGVSALSSGEILDSLDAAIAAYLIEETPVGYRFRHPLIRRTLYDNLSRVRRASQHTRVAESIEAISSIRYQGRIQHIEALAYHYDLSDRRDRGLPYLVQAGENAAGVFAFEVAAEHFERALDLMDALGKADPAFRWRLLESLGGWYAILADTPKAVACFEQALALDPQEDWQPAARDLVRLHSSAAVALITAGDMDGADQHLRKALQKIDIQGEASEYADLLYNIALLHWHRNEYQQAMENAQSSLEIARRLDHPETIARAYEMLALSCHALGEWQAGITYEKQRVEFAGVGLDVTDAFDVHL